MRGKTAGLSVLVSVLVCLGGCDEATSGPQLSGFSDGRQIGFGVTEGSIGYEKAFAEAKRAGIQFIELPQQWDEIEVEPGKYESAFLEMANSVYSATNTNIVLSMNPIDTNALRLPEHLKNKNFNDPELVAAFIKFADYLIDGLPDAKIVAISVGNEVDAYLAGDPQKWKQYQSFFKIVKQHLEQKIPGVPVGVKTTFAAATKSHRAAIEGLNDLADAVMVTYYPLDERFKVMPTSSIAKDLERLVEVAKDKPVHLLETGFPSGKANGSSEKLQAEFVSCVFAAWDKHAAKMPLVNFVWLCDMSKKEVGALTQYYKSDDAAFASFLGTLGLKTHSGKNKLAFDQLIAEVKQRQ